MFKGLKKITLYVLGIYLVLVVLHLWLNIGFDKLGLGSSKTIAGETERFRVGFIPVT